MRTPLTAAFAAAIGLVAGLALGTVGLPALGLGGTGAAPALGATPPAPPAAAAASAPAAPLAAAPATTDVPTAVALAQARAERAEAQLRSAERVLEMVGRAGGGRPGAGGAVAAPSRDLATLGAAVEAAKSAGDGSVLLDALREAVALGEPGLPLALAIMRDLKDDQRGAKRYDVSSAVFGALLRTEAFAPLHRYAIERPGADPAEQISAVWTLAFSAAPDTKPYFGRLLQSGVTETLARNMISAMGHDLTQESIGVLLQTLQTPATTAGARRAIAEALRGTDRRDSIPALETLAFQDPDAEVREAAKATLTLLRPPVAGYGITGTSGHGMAGDVAGLKPGDIITAYNGAPVTDAAALSAAAKALPPTETATLRVWRDGQAIEVKLRGGSLPAFGRLVTPP